MSQSRLNPVVWDALLSEAYDLTERGALLIARSKVVREQSVIYTDFGRAMAPELPPDPPRRANGGEDARPPWSKPASPQETPHHSASGNLYRITAGISAAIAAGEEAQTLSDRQIARIEEMVDALGVFAARIDEPLRLLESVLTELRLRNAEGHALAKATAYANVKEIWGEVEPALSECACETGVWAKRQETERFTTTPQREAV